MGIGRIVNRGRPGQAGGIEERAFQRVGLWLDPTPRPGPENMAVDEWLLGAAADAGMTLLRVYRWLGAWVSYGYALDAGEAQRQFPGAGVQFVRRWTGGGVVDHRGDWTYTLAIPAGEPLAGHTAPERYRAIHAALAAALRGAGIAAALADGSGVTGSHACFRNPVCHDLIDPAGRKLAGAGQRKARSGVLHQGSVAVGSGAELAAPLANHLAEAVTPVALAPPPATIQQLVGGRYGAAGWMSRGSGTAPRC